MKRLIKKGVNNYVINLKYLLTPLGAIAIGAVFGLSIALPAVISAISRMFGEVADVLGRSEIDLSSFGDEIYQAVTALEWRNPFSALQTMLSSDWLTDTFSNALLTLVGSFDEHAVKIGEAITRCVDVSKMNFNIFIALTALGLVGGYYLTRWLIRRNMAKRAWWKGLLISVADGVFSTLVLAFCMWFASLWQFAMYVSFALGMFIYAIAVLFEAYLIHGYNRIALREAVNLKNASGLIISAINYRLVPDIYRRNRPFNQQANRSVYWKSRLSGCNIGHLLQRRKLRKKYCGRYRRAEITRRFAYL